MLASLVTCLGSSERETAERRRPVVHEKGLELPGSPHRQHHTAAEPFVYKADRWLKLTNGNEAAVCDACFPQSATATHLCLPECIFPTSDILEVQEHVVEGKVAPEGQPWFIIGYGPPASGKAGIVAALERLSAFGVTPRNTVATEVDGSVSVAASVRSRKGYPRWPGRTRSASRRQAGCTPPTASWPIRSPTPSFGRPRRGA